MQLCWTAKSATKRFMATVYNRIETPFVLSACSGSPSPMQQWEFTDVIAPATDVRSTHHAKFTHTMEFYQTSIINFTGIDLDRTSENKSASNNDLSQSSSILFEWSRWKNNAYFDCACTIDRNNMRAARYGKSSSSRSYKCWLNEMFFSSFTAFIHILFKNAATKISVYPIKIEPGIQFHVFSSPLFQSPCQFLSKSACVCVCILHLMTTRSNACSMVCAMCVSSCSIRLLLLFFRGFLFSLKINI